MYPIPCKNRGAEYIGETWRLQYTRREGKRLMSNVNKSVLTDYVTTENHIVDWEGLIKSQTEEPDN